MPDSNLPDADTRSPLARTGFPRPAIEPVPTGSETVRPAYTFWPPGESSPPDGKAPSQTEPSSKQPPGPPRAAATIDAALARAAGERTPRRAGPLPIALYRPCDTAAALVALGVALILRNVGNMPAGLDGFLSVRWSLKNLLLLAAFALAWRLSCTVCGLYRRECIQSRREEAARVLAACTLGSAAGLMFLLTSRSGAFDVWALGLLWVETSLALQSARWGLRAFAVAKGRPARNVLVVGTGPRAIQISQRLSADSEVDYTLVGYVDTEVYSRDRQVRDRVVAHLADLENTLLHSPVDEVVVALPVRSRYVEIEWVVETCERMGVAVTLPGDPFRISGSHQFRPRKAEGIVALTLSEGPEGFRLWVKRGLDLVGASTVLVLCAPLLLLVAVLIRLNGRGPVLFGQTRYGYNRRLFRMHKFRTMVANAEGLQSSLEYLNEAEGPLFKIRRDPRITWIGRILRRSSIDELPQLFNVLRGEMSLVGPRPLAVRDVHHFTDAALAKRFSVRPGMTGLWQVRGRSSLGYDQWAALDLQYVNEWSLALDLKILALTLPAVLRGSGAE